MPQALSPFSTPTFSLAFSSCYFPHFFLFSSPYPLWAFIPCGTSKNGFPHPHSRPQLTNAQKREENQPTVAFVPGGNELAKGRFERWGNALKTLPLTRPESENNDRMDVVLNKMGNQPDLKHIEGLFDAIQKAKSSLQLPPTKSRPHERRRQCIDCFRLALSSGRQKFAAITFEGIQLILRDHGTWGIDEGETPEGDTRTAQLLELFSHIPTWRDQCQSLTVLVQMISSTELPVRLGDVLSALEICKRTFQSASDDATNVRPAARAALTQMLNSYVQNRFSSLGEGGESSTEIEAASDVTALLGELISRMGLAVGELMELPLEKSPVAGASRPSGMHKLASQPLLLPLDALFSVLSALEPPLVARHPPLLNLLKSELVPVVICHLHGSSKVSAGVGESNNAKAIGALVGTLKRAGRISTDSPSGIVPVAKALDGAESARSFYQVIDQLLRLFSPIVLSPPSDSSSTVGMLALLEELWRAALLAPPVTKRAEALRLAKRICGEGRRFGELIQLSEASGRDTFWLVLVQCMEECGTGTTMTTEPEQQRMAADSLRTLGALFSAISQLLRTSPTEFDNDHFFVLLAKREENDDQQQKEQKSNGILTENPNNTKEKAARLFADAFVRQLQQWDGETSVQSLDLAMQEFCGQVFSQINDGLCPGGQNAMDGRNGEEASAVSTPEDSGEEAEVEERRKKEEQNGGSGRILGSEVEVFGMMAELVGKMVIMDPEKDEWARQKIPETETQIPTMYGVSLANAPTSSHQLVPLILHHLHPSSSSHKCLSLFSLSAPDPLILPSASSPDHHLLPHLRPLLLFRSLRRRLHNCWTSFVHMFTGTETEEGKSAVVEAMTILTPLAIELGMPAELQWIFEHIGEKVCVLEDLRAAIRKSAKSRTNDDPKGARRFCGRSEMMAMQVLMENAFRALVIAPKVSKHTIRCVQFLWELERWHFKLAKSTIDAIYEPPALPIPPSPSGHHSPIGQLIGCTSPGANELSSTEIARLMDQFLTLIDRLFSDAPGGSLPMDSLCALLRSICAANEDNLCYSAGLAPTESSAQLLLRLCQLLNGLGPSPLLHKFNAWSIIRDHLILVGGTLVGQSLFSGRFCASTSDAIPAEINRRALDGLQDVVGALLGRECDTKKGMVAIVSGWNALLFEAFPQIIQSNSGKCSPETCQQIGQILLAFVEQNPELLCSAWTPLFRTVKLISDKFFTELAVESSSGGQHQLVLDIFDKFLAIPSPAVLLRAFSDFSGSLAHFVSLCSAASAPSSQAVFDQSLSLLERSGHLLLDQLLGCPIPPRGWDPGLVTATEHQLDAEWCRFLGALNGIRGERRRRDAESSEGDYLNMLDDMKTVLIEQWKKRPEGMEILGEWLEADKNPTVKDQSPQIPWRHLPSNSSGRIVSLHAFRLLQKLMCAILHNDSGESSSHRSRLALSMGQFLLEISAKLSMPFGAFCACAIPLMEYRKAVATPLLTGPGARSLKQLIGISCAHQSVLDLLTNPSPDGEQWAHCVLRCVLDLAIRCVAKGGTLSLAGCALLRRICAPCASSSIFFRVLCAHALWHCSSYALFPVRMLLGQFSVNSTDFSGNLGHMRVSYRLGLSPSEVEEKVDNVQQLARELFQLEEQQSKQKDDRRESAGEVGHKGRRQSAGGAHFPSKFAYLFIFETSAGDGKGEPPKKLSMGMDELVDSVLCQQLLISLAAEELNRTSPGEELDRSSAAPVHGPLLATLYATVAICEQFELRPGLKSLLQKLAGLSWSANLWKLTVPALSALIRWHLRQAVFENEQKRMNHLKGITALIRRIGKRGEEGDDEPEEKEEDGRRGAPRATNPLVISTQMSLDSRMTANVGEGAETTTRAEIAEEDNRARSFALCQLLANLRSEIISLMDELKEAKITDELLIEMEEIGKELPEEGDGKSRELLGRIIEEIKQRVESR